MYCQHSQFLYSDTPVPRFNSQPYTVFETPGLGNFYDDYYLYSPVRSYGDDVKEVEKKLDLDEGGGGFELNAPLIVEPLVSPRKKTKRIQKNAKTKSQKGHGNEKIVAPTDREIEDALQHPIKVVYVTNFNYVFFLPFL